MRSGPATADRVVWLRRKGVVQEFGWDEWRGREIVDSEVKGYLLSFLGYLAGHHRR